MTILSKKIAGSHGRCGNRASNWNSHINSAGFRYTISIEDSVLTAKVRSS